MIDKDTGRPCKAGRANLNNRNVRIVLCKTFPVLAGFSSLMVCSGCEKEPLPADDETGESVCYDNFDNDGDMSVDCQDDGCSGLLPCCAGMADLGCCQTPVPAFNRSFATCTLASLTKCAPQTVALGEPAFVEGALAPRRFATAAEVDFGPDTGVYFSQSLDLKGSNYRFTFEAARASACGDACLDFLRIGFVSAASPPTGVPRVFYDFAVTLRPAFGDLILNVGDAIQALAPVDDAFHRYVLETRTDETLSLYEINEAGSTVRTLIERTPLGFNDPAYLVIAGRSGGLAAGVASSRIRSVAVERGRCDRPQAVRAGTAPVIPVPLSPEAAALRDVEGVGRATNASGTELVLVDSGSAFHPFRKVAGAYAPLRSLASPFLSLADIPTPDRAAIDDPWVVVDEAARRWIVYFTVRTGTAPSGPDESFIAQVSSGPEFATTADLSTFARVADPASGYRKLEMPTVLGDLMVARVGINEFGVLVRLRRSGSTWVPVGDNILDGEIRRAGDPSGIDRDEVADPALVRDGDAYRLYYAGRRGTRWRLGFLMSEGGEHWYAPLVDQPLWVPEGGRFDALGVRDSAPHVVDGEVELLYRGWNGIVSQVGRAYSNSPRSFPLPVR